MAARPLLYEAVIRAGSRHGRQGACPCSTGGSIRQPAHFCGCVGIKPTYGRVSRYGLIAYGSSLDCVGPLARTVEDAALLLGAISGERLLHWEVGAARQTRCFADHQQVSLCMQMPCIYCHAAGSITDAYTK